MSDGTASTDAEATNFTWVLTNGDEAASGLQSGRYAAVVTIPPSFSAAATSIGGPATAARQAVIEVTTTPASAFLDPALTEVITAAATASLNQQLISQYLGNVYAGFNTINEQIGQASDGAASLASGAASVSSGAEQLASGAEQLAGGLASLDSGAEALGADSASSIRPPRHCPARQRRSHRARRRWRPASTRWPRASTARPAVRGSGGRDLPDARAVCDRATAALSRLQDVDAQVGDDREHRRPSGGGQRANWPTPWPAGRRGSTNRQSEPGTWPRRRPGEHGGRIAELGCAVARRRRRAGRQRGSAAGRGLSSAVEEIPTYSDEDITMLSSVVSQPVLADQSAIDARVPVGAAVRDDRAVVRRARDRARPPAVPPAHAAHRRRRQGRSSAGRRGVTAALGAGQGLVVAVALLFGVSIGPLSGSGSRARACIIGAVFALVNQGLAAAFGAVGRLIALLIGLVALAAGITRPCLP